MTGVDDQVLIAYLDGELDPLERLRVEAALIGNAALRRRLETQRRLSERLAARYDIIVREPVPDHLRQLVVAHAAVPAGTNAPAPRLLQPRWAGLASLAAALALFLVAGPSPPDGAGAPISAILMPEGAGAPKRVMAAPAAPTRILDGRVRPDRAAFIVSDHPIDGRRHSRASG